jgi:hypothetical protein
MHDTLKTHDGRFTKDGTGRAAVNLRWNQHSVDQGVEDIGDAMLAHEVGDAVMNAADASYDDESIIVEFDQ